MRDFELYSESYKKIPFERIQSSIRREYCLDLLKYYRPTKWAEVGCALNPLFTDYHEANDVTVIEPSHEFFRNAQYLSSQCNSKVSLYNCVVEDFLLKKNCNNTLHGHNLVISSAVLHECDDQKKFLESLRLLGGENTIYAFTAPNSHSLHRLLAFEMGIIDDLTELSDQQKLLKQSSFFSKDQLINLLDSSDFSVESIDSIILKPFTHYQMQKILDHQIIDVNCCASLAKMASRFPGLGSEWLLTCLDKRQE